MLMITRVFSDVEPQVFNILFHFLCESSVYKSCEGNNFMSSQLTLSVILGFDIFPIQDILFCLREKRKVIMKSTMLKSLILTLIVTNIATVQAARPDEKAELSREAARKTDRTDLGVSAEDREVNQGDSEKPGVNNDGEKPVTDGSENEELKDKDSGTADVQVVYKVHGAIDNQLKKNMETDLSEAMCDREAYEDCDEKEIDIRSNEKHFDVISYSVLNGENSEGTHEERAQGSLDRCNERSTEVVYRKGTEVVYRKDGTPKNDRSHCVVLRERGSNFIYTATMREVDRDEDIALEGDQESRRQRRNRTYWLSELERSNGDSN
jgi:hypothetical protein